MSDRRAGSGAPWRSRIIGEGEEAPDQLLANPRNWRIHPRQQQAAIDELLTRVGWVQRVVVNERTGHVVDGHARVGLAISRGEPSVPVVYVDLDEAEELLVLATLDPIGAMAAADRDAVASIVADLNVSDEALRALLRSLTEDAPTLAVVEPTEAALPPQFRCPECGHEWDGLPR